MVKFNYLLTLLGIFTLFSFVSAYEGECAELKDTINENLEIETYLIEEYEEYGLSFNHCYVDENGKMTELSLKGNGLTQDAIDKIAKYKSLNILDIARLGEISNISMEALHLSSISFNDLKFGGKNNKFQGHTISDKVIKSLKNVDNITIIGYQITQDIIDAFSTLTNVKEINMSSCGFDENLDFSKVKKAKKLTTLEFESYSKAQPLGQFSETLCKVTQLKKLSILSKITSIPKCIYKLKKLEYLDLSYNEIAELPKEFGNIPKLKYLNLSDNNFNSMPSMLGNLSKLEELYLENNNEITNFTSNLCESKNLINLGLNNCQITSIPSCIKNLTKLKILNLNSNALTSIPSSICKLSNLEFLDMSHNTKISTVPSSFKNLKNLKFLDLSHNEITVIPNALGKLVNLEHLNLAYNQINDTIPESLNNLKELTFLSSVNNVDIRGKTLTNPKLISCDYNTAFNASENGLCLAENTVCKPVDEIPQC